MAESHIRSSHKRLLLAHLCIVLAVSTVGRANGEVADPLDRYNVVWDSPSKDHNGSIPIGNGDIGPITKRVRELYLGLINGNNPKYAHWCTPVTPTGS